MKTNRTLITTGAAIALFALASSVLAQYRPTGPDGITASPKVRHFLNEYERSHSSRPALQVARMPCAKCKDEATQRVDWSARGAHKPTFLVVTHLCKGCGTKWTITGAGKGKEAVAIHTCTGCGSKTLACCNAEAGSAVATEGMRKTFDVAPLK